MFDLLDWQFLSLFLYFRFRLIVNVVAPALGENMDEYQQYLDQLVKQLKDVGYDDHSVFLAEIDDYIRRHSRGGDNSTIRNIMIKNGLEEGLRQFNEENKTPQGFLMAQYSIARLQFMQRQAGVAPRPAGCCGCVLIFVLLPCFGGVFYSSIQLIKSVFA